MTDRNIIERLRERHENRDNPSAWQQAICTYEEERDEAADEIQRLYDQLSVVHASASDIEYSQWERIRELEEAVEGVMREFGSRSTTSLLMAALRTNRLAKL